MEHFKQQIDQAVQVRDYAAAQDAQQACWSVYNRRAVSGPLCLQLHIKLRICGCSTSLCAQECYTLSSEREEHVAAARKQLGLSHED